MSWVTYISLNFLIGKRNNNDCLIRLLRIMWEKNMWKHMCCLLYSSGYDWPTEPYTPTFILFPRLSKYECASGVTLLGSSLLTSPCEGGVGCGAGRPSHLSHSPLQAPWGHILLLARSCSSFGSQKRHFLRKATLHLPIRRFHSTQYFPFETGQL